MAILSVGEDVEQQKLLYISSGRINQNNHFGKATFTLLSKDEGLHSLYDSISGDQYLSILEMLMNSGMGRYRQHTWHNGHNLEYTQTAISRRMD